MKKFFNLLKITICVIVFLAICYGAFKFNAVAAAKFCGIFVGSLIILAIAFLTESFIRKRNLQLSQTLKSILAVPTLIVCILPGITMVWIIGAAAIAFGLPFFSNAFLAGIVIMLVFVFFLFIYLERINR